MKKLVILSVILVLLFSFCKSKEEKAAEEALVNKGKEIATAQELKNIGSAIEDYMTDEYKAPEAASIDELRKLLEPFYIKKLPMTDHWGNKYYYKHGTGDQREDYWVASAGADGKFEDFQKVGDDIVYHNGQLQ